MAGSSPAPQTSPGQLQTLVSTLQSLVQAINSLNSMLTAALSGITDPNGTN